MDSRNTIAAASRKEGSEPQCLAHEISSSSDEPSTEDDAEMFETIRQMHEHAVRRMPVPTRAMDAPES